MTEPITLRPGEPIEITSPNFPGFYDNNVDKTWYIIAPPGYSVAIDFPVFRLESGFDFLSIYEGVTGDVDDRLLIHKLTGNEIVDRVTSFGSHVWLWFTSDFSFQEQGFRLIITVVESIGAYFTSSF